MVIQHPVTTERDNREHHRDDAERGGGAGMPTIWFWPNPDAGTDEMAESLRHVREQHAELTEQMRFITNVPADEFVALLRQAACVVGNSSAGIKECSFLGTPVVNIGGRQQGRLAADHVRHVPTTRDAIRAAIAAQIAHGRYAPSTIYLPAGHERADVDVLATAELYTQKRFYESTPVRRAELYAPRIGIPRPREAARRHHRARRIEGHSRQEPQAARREAADRLHASSRRTQSGAFDRLVLSTDDDAIAEYARALGCDVPFMRPAELARDETPHLPVHAARRALAATSTQAIVPDAVMILQPTSPLRRAEDIRDAIGLLAETGADSVAQRQRGAGAHAPDADAARRRRRARRAVRDRRAGSPPHQPPAGSAAGLGDERRDLRVSHARAV